MMKKKTLYLFGLLSFLGAFLIFSSLGIDGTGIISTEQYPRVNERVQGDQDHDPVIRLDDPIDSAPDEQAAEEGSIPNEDEVSIPEDDIKIEEPVDLDERVISKKTPQGFLVVAIVNQGHYEFLENFYTAMRRIGLHRSFLVVALDKSLEQMSTSLGVTTIPGTHFTSLPGYDDPEWKKEMMWSHSDYNQLVNTKIVIVDAILRRYNLNVVFTDVDLVWLQPKMLDYIKYYFDVGQFDFIMARDVWDTLYNACTGFYAVRPTDWALGVMQKVMTSEMKRGNNDQVVFNILMGSYPREDLLRIYYLPLELFMNGQSFDMGLQNMYNVKPFLFHANYRVGKVEKRKLLQQAGYWYVK
jgi:hypothetical protein